MRKLFRRLAIVFGAPVTAHPCGKVYVRVFDHWMPI